jgi:hypothetical protein
MNAQDATPRDIVAAYLYNSRPIVYRPWVNALDPAIEHFRIEAQQLLDMLRSGGYTITPTTQENRNG